MARSFTGILKILGRRFYGLSKVPADGFHLPCLCLVLGIFLFLSLKKMPAVASVSNYNMLWVEVLQPKKKTSTRDMPHDKFPGDKQALVYLQMSLISVVFRSEFLWWAHMHTLTVIKNGGPNKPLWFHGIKSNWLPDCHSSSLIKRLRPRATSLSSGPIIEPPHPTPPTRPRPPIPPAPPKVSFLKHPQISWCLLLSNTPPPNVSEFTLLARVTTMRRGHASLQWAMSTVGPLGRVSGPSVLPPDIDETLEVSAASPSSSWFDVNNLWCLKGPPMTQMAKAGVITCTTQYD